MPAIGKSIPTTITNLTNEELANELQQYNFTPGPILASTRGVYERKLFKLQTGQEAVTTCTYEPVDDDEEDQDDEVTFQPQMPRQRMTRSTKPEVATPPRQPPMTRNPLPRGKLHTSPLISAKPKSGIPTWVKFMAVLIIAAIVFLMVRNLEADPASQSPEIPESLEFDV